MAWATWPWVKLLLAFLAFHFQLPQSFPRPDAAGPAGTEPGPPPGRPASGPRCQVASSVTISCSSRPNLLLAQRHFLVQPLPAFAMPLQTIAQVAGLFGQHVDLFLLLGQGDVEPFAQIAQLGQVLLDVGQTRVELGHLFLEFEQFAAARKNAGLGVMGADGQRAVRFEQFALQGHEAKAGSVGGDGLGGGQIADDQRAAQKLARQIGQLRMIAGNHLLGRRDQARMGRCFAYAAAGAPGSARRLPPGDCRAGRHRPASSSFEANSDCSGKKLTRPENGSGFWARARTRSWMSRTTKRWAQSPRARSISGAHSRFTVRKSAIMPSTVAHGPEPLSACSIEGRASRARRCRALRAFDTAVAALRSGWPGRCVAAAATESCSPVRSRSSRSRSASCRCLGLLLAQLRPAGLAGPASASVSSCSSTSTAARFSAARLDLLRSRSRSRLRLSTWALQETTSFCKWAERRICSRCSVLSAAICLFSACDLAARSRPGAARGRPLPDAADRPASAPRPAPPRPAAALWASPATRSASSVSRRRVRSSSLSRSAVRLAS